MKVCRHMFNFHCTYYIALISLTKRQPTTTTVKSQLVAAPEGTDALYLLKTVDILRVSDNTAVQQVLQKRAYYKQSEDVNGK